MARQRSGDAAAPLRAGWREWVALPDLGVERIKAKLDTGAATSALHAVHIRRFSADGVDRVAFDVHPDQHRAYRTVSCVAAVVDERLFKSSNGHRERRLVIRQLLAIGGRQFPIEISLTNRDTMGFRMLIGRSAMKRRVLVDPGSSFCAGDPRAAVTGIQKARGARGGRR
jgi:hypothetical protein